MLPPVSVAVAIGASLAATADALPPDEPPGTSLRFHGFLQGPKKLVSLEDPIANSSILVLPRVNAPAEARRAMIVASYGDLKFANIFEPHVVRWPFMQKISL